MMGNKKEEYGCAVNEYTKNLIAGLIPKRIVPFDYYEERDIDSEMKNWIERTDGDFAVVAGDAGFGKTSLLCNLANKFLNKEEDYAIFFVKSENLMEKEFDEKILDNLDITEIDLDDLLRKVADENRKVVFLLDTLDIITTDDGIARLDDFITRVRGVNVVVIGTSRHLEFKRIENLTTKTFELKPFSDDEIRRLFKKYKTLYNMEEVDLNLPVLEVCRNPLHMRMLFEVYQPHEIPEDINVQKLYDRYWDKKVSVMRSGVLSHLDNGKKRKAERVKEDLARNMAYMMLTSRQITLIKKEIKEIKDEMREEKYFKMFAVVKNSNKVAIKQKMEIERLVIKYNTVIDDAYHDLLDEGVLREQEGLVEFFHQNFFEYAVAKALIGKEDEKQIKEFLSGEDVVVQSLAVGILVRNKHLDVDRILCILWQIIERDASSHLTTRTIQYLVEFGREKFDDIIWIIDQIVESGKYEYYWSILVLIKDTGIESSEIIEILKKLATAQLTGLRWYTTRKEAFELLKEMGVNIVPETFKMDYLGELRQMTLEEALDYVGKLAQSGEEGATDADLFAFDHNFLFFVLRELYKECPYETCVLMKYFLTILERSPFQHIFEILGEHRYFNSEIIRSFVKSDNKLVSFTGFMALEYALNKVVDGEVANVDEGIKNEILKILSEIKTWEEKNPLLAAMAAVTYGEATNPPNPMRIRWDERIRTKLVKSAVESIGPRMAKNFMVAEDNEDKIYHVVMYWATYRGILHTKPDKLREVFRVIGKDDAMFLRVCNCMYDMVRTSPEGALDILYKSALISGESQIRVAAVDMANIVGRLAPEKVLEIYEKVLPLTGYQDNRTRLTVVHNFRNFLETSHADRARKNLMKLMDDHDQQVGMLADIILNGIKFRA